MSSRILLKLVEIINNNFLVNLPSLRNSFLNWLTNKWIFLILLIIILSLIIFLCLKKITDEKKIRVAAMNKIINFYQEVAWGSISSILDHVLLWWSSKALAISHSRGAQHFKDWLHRFLKKNQGTIKIIVNKNKLNLFGFFTFFVLQFQSL